MPENKIKIPEDTIETVLEPYDQEERYLEEAEIREDYKRKHLLASGWFSIRRTPYMSEEEHVEHVTSAEYKSCIKRLMCGIFPGLEELEFDEISYDVPLEEFWDERPDIRMRGFSADYRRPVNPSSFQGELLLKQQKSLHRGKMHFFDTEFDFEDGRASGEVRLALNFRDEEV